MNRLDFGLVSDYTETILELRLEKGNTVGSLSEKQQSIIEGCLLGDGYMRCKTNAHLQVTHSIDQKLYVDWKYFWLKEFILTPPKSYIGNGKRIGYRFFTRSLPEFTKFFNRFYKNGKKVIPYDVRLDPLTLAVWFMDDGSKSRRSCYLNTQQFNLNDQDYLVNRLHKKYGLLAKLDKDKKYLRIRFSVSDSCRFIKIIGPHTLPFMQYKFPI